MGKITIKLSDQRLLFKAVKYLGGVLGVIDKDVSIKIMMKTRYELPDYIAGRCSWEDIKDSWLNDIGLLITDRILEELCLREVFPPNRVQVVRAKSDFRPEKLCKSGECISKLIIEGHGNYQNGNAIIELVSGQSLFEMYDDRAVSEISKLFEYEADKNPFCKEVEIQFISCYLGKNPKLKERIEKNLEKNGVKATVKAYPYSVLGNGWPTLPEVFNMVFS